MESGSPFTVRVESRAGVVRLALTGELDMMTVPVLAKHLSQAEGDGVTEIMVDLRELAFIDATGLHAFLNARADAEANGHRLILGGAGERARRLFELTGTEFLLDDQEAVRVLDTSTPGNGSQPAQKADAE